MTSYTVSDIDNYVENDFNPEEDYDSWGEFSEEVGQTYDFLKNADGSYVRSPETNRLVRVERDEPGHLIPNIGRAVLVESRGGEGQGDEYWFVFKIIDSSGGERLFKRLGWYASYDGGHYEGPTVEVRPVEKTITVWEEAK